jgi:phosphoglycerate dehydrogenase-like enzyme
MVTRIAILDDFHKVAMKLADWSTLRDCEVVAFQDHVGDPKGLIERLKNFDVVCAMRERTAFPREVFEGLPRLKLLIVTGGRHTRVFDFDAALDHGVTVCRSDNRTPTADGSEPRGGTQVLTFGLMVALLRGIVMEDRGIRKGGWVSGLGGNSTLQGLTLGVVGLGRIGAEMAEIGRFFAMKVIAWSENLTDERAAAAGARRVSKDELFRQSDFVTVHMRLSDRTERLVGAHEFGLMKPSAYFINTSRGEIVDEKALIEVLQQRRIAGAALDVYEVEPLPVDSPLRTLDNTILTPHIGYVSEAKLRMFYESMVEGVQAWLDGAPIRMLKPRAPGESRSTGYWVDA